MAGLEGLASMIYHEKQQPGSMLCAQHALNSLMQGNYFQASDLSEIARGLDALEVGYDDDNTGQTSTNMDDTGFFSVQVLENALKVWGLTTVRWRSEEMKPYQDRPFTQLAFILNLEQHWFTLRRFGPAQSDLEEDEGKGHWFNLNSFLDSPEWVSRTYLGMVLQQAEMEGYSVFAICQIDPTEPLALPRVDADEVAETLPQPSSSSGASGSGSGADARFVGKGQTLSTVRTPSAPVSHVGTPGIGGAGGLGGPYQHIEGLEDEDMELQAALQASMGYEVDPAMFAGTASRSAPPQLPTMPESGGFGGGGLGGDFGSPGLGGLGGGLGGGGGLGLPPIAPIDAHDPNDPVAASMARNRAIMQRMMAEQRHALRGAYEDEVQDRFYGPGGGRGGASGAAGPSMVPPGYMSMGGMRRAGVPAPISAGQEGGEEAMDEDEDVQIIDDDDDDTPSALPTAGHGQGQERRRSTRPRRQPQPPGSAAFPRVPPNTAAPGVGPLQAHWGGGVEEEDVDEEEYARQMDRIFAESAAAAAAAVSASTTLNPSAGFGGVGGQGNEGQGGREHATGPRVYDDEDAELQAALRASLEGLPEDFEFPPSPPPTTHPLPRSEPASSQARTQPPTQTSTGGQALGGRQRLREESAEPEFEEPKPEEVLSVDEVRRRRLARFGG